MTNTNFLDQEKGTEILPTEVKEFHHSDLQFDQKQAHANIEQILIRNKDFKWRVDNRGYFGWSIMGLLISQHFFLYGLILCAYFQSCLKDIQWLLSGFFFALMTETYFTINLLFKWLFSEIPYDLRRDKSSTSE